MLEEADRILDRLDVHSTETELVQGINDMLRQLDGYGIIRSTPRGGVWDR